MVLTVNRGHIEITLEWDKFCDLFSEVKIGSTCYFETISGTVRIEKHGQTGKLVIGNGEEAYDILVPDKVTCKIYEYAEITDTVFKNRAMQYGVTTVDCSYDDIFRFRVNVGKVSTLKLEVTKLNKETFNFRIRKKSLLAQSVIELSRRTGTYTIRFKKTKESDTGKELKKPYYVFETPEMREKQNK